MGIKVGVYDSGVGGLTVLRSLIKHRVADTFIYFGDTARAPYGIKSEKTIKRYAKECTSFLRSKGIDFLAVACNTVSALALQEVKETFCRGVIGTIKPVVDLICSDLTVKKVGIIGTQATIQSCVYEEVVRKRRPDIKIFSLATPLFVPLIEEGIKDKNVLSTVCSYYLGDFVKNNIDLLLLACTHFPLVAEILESFFNNKVKLLDCANPLALTAKKMFATKQETANYRYKPRIYCYLTDSSPVFLHLLQTLLPSYAEVSVEKVELDNFLSIYGLAS